MTIPRVNHAPDMMHRSLAKGPMRTFAFPVVFVIVQVVTALRGASANDAPLVIDSVLLTLPMALLIWPAHAIATSRLSRLTVGLTDRQQFITSAVSGGLSVFSVYPFKLIVPERMWDYARIGFPLMYWSVAAGLTLAVLWLFNRWNQRSTN